MSGLQPDGLPHSDIPGSRAVCASPGLFAAYRVLRRLREPRHPPSALLFFPASCRFPSMQVFRTCSLSGTPHFTSFSGSGTICFFKVVLLLYFIELSSMSKTFCYLNGSELFSPFDGRESGIPVLSRFAASTQSLPIFSITCGE